MVNSEASEQKKLLREEVRAARAKRLEGHHCEDQHDEHVVLFLADNGFRKIAAYVATDDEPCTDLLLGVCEEVGIQVLVPRVSGDELEWVLFDWDRLSEGAFGILEPIGPAEPLQVEAIIVPALAVDSTGVRLGKGKGFYDRALASVGANIPVIALVHDAELVEELPHQPHDRRVTHVAACSFMHEIGKG